MGSALTVASFEDSSSDQAEETENLERALLYVSATRAKKKVLMTCYGEKQSFFNVAH